MHACIRYSFYAMKLTSESYIESQLQSIFECLDFSDIEKFGSKEFQDKVKGINGTSLLYFLWDCKVDICESTYFHQRDIEIPLGELELQKEDSQNWEDILENLDDWVMSGNEDSLAYTTCLGLSAKFDEKELDSFVEEYWADKAREWIEDNFVLLFGDSFGTKIPELFCHQFERNNATEFDWEACKSGKQELDSFWDCWNNIESNWEGKIDGVEMGIFQSGDLWAFPLKGMRELEDCMREHIWDCFV